jgi:hypothetical protein
LVRAFFVTKKEFSKKDEVKKVIVSELLSKCVSSDEEVATNAGLLLFNGVVLYSSTNSGEKEHPYFGWMKSTGILDEIHSTFKRCLFDKVKRLIGVSMINIDRGCSCLEKTNEIISWLVETTSLVTVDDIRNNTLIVFRQLVFRFICFVEII